jgi:hypothetical protein
VSNTESLSFVWTNSTIDFKVALGTAGDDTFNLSTVTGGGVFNGAGGTDAVQMNVDSFTNMTPEFHLTQDNSNTSVWHLTDSAAQPHTLLDITKLAGDLPAYDLVFHNPASSATMTNTIVNVEALNFIASNSVVMNIDFTGTVPQIL